jgi:indole-3-glycerol phosphate synthase
MGEMGVLGEIVAKTRERVREQQSALPLEQLLASCGPVSRRPFGHVLSRTQVNVIAEFKRQSPSRGVIRPDLEPDDVAVSYEAAGAVALSVLTEADYFGGSGEDLRRAHGATLLPVLRKDFIVDAYQVWEAAALGADALLLIVAALGDDELRVLLETTAGAGLEALVEVHDREELARALAVGARIVGVNSRDLKTMAVSLDTALELAPAIPDDVIAVAESGIKTGEDIKRLRAAGYDAFLVGEQLMRTADPGVGLAALLRDAQEAP